MIHLMIHTVHSLSDWDHHWFTVLPQCVIHVVVHPPFIYPVDERRDSRTTWITPCRPLCKHMVIHVGCESHCSSTGQIKEQCMATWITHWITLYKNRVIRQVGDWQLFCPLIRPLAYPLDALGDSGCKSCGHDPCIDPPIWNESMHRPLICCVHEQCSAWVNQWVGDVHIDLPIDLPIGRTM